MHLRRYVRTVFWLFLLSCSLVTFGCAATYIKATVNGNPLDNVAQQARGVRWSVERVDENTLHLRDNWPIYSVVSLGYTASYADLSYDPAVQELDMKFYIKSIQLFWLYIPVYIDADYGVFYGLLGGSLKPILSDQISDVLRWSDATVTERRTGSESEPFPPRRNTPPPDDQKTGANELK